MKRLILSIAIALPAISSIANPLNFPKYTQKVVVEYATPAEAESATLSMAGLPDNARVAFTTRWDDTNPAHLQKGEMLARAGYPSTFFLTYWPDSESFYHEPAKRLLELGHTFGNHTASHPFINKISENQFFSEIVNQKITIETKTGCTVVSYVSPYGWPRDLDEAHRRLYVDMLIATGHHTSQDAVDVPVRGNTNIWFQTHRMWVNDRDPNKEVFDRELAKMEREFKENGGFMPCFSYGIHSWGDHDKVNAKQEEMLKGIRNHDDWYYCNANQYGAYRYQYFHGNVKKIGVNGKVAEFEISRFKPAQLGADVPLSLIVSGNPVKVFGNEKLLKKTKRSAWILPSRDGEMMPKVIDVIKVKEGIKSSKIDGMSATLDIDSAKCEATLTIKNETADEISDVFGAMYLPPAWQTRRITFDAESVAKGKTFVKKFSLGVKSTTVALEENALYACSFDFNQNGSLKRVYVVK